MRLKKIFIVENSVLYLFLLFTGLGILSFDMLPQVVYLVSNIVNNEHLKEYSSVIFYLEENNPHTLRTLLMLPFYFLYDYFSINVNLSFGIAVILLIFLTYKNIIYIYPVNNKIKTLILLSLMTLTIFMNGRIAFAIYGNSLLLKIFYRRYFILNIRYIKFILNLLIALFFTTVSTGTSIVAIGTIITFYFFIFILNKFRKIRSINYRVLFDFISILVLLIGIFRNIIIMYIDKNLDYFGSFSLMLHHGIGKYFRGWMIFILPLLIFMLIILMQIIRKINIIIVPLSLTISAGFIGIFGISSLVSGISGFIVSTLLILNIKYVKKNYTK
ncbi:hypothetical protein [Actinobacillus delphinicola]|uniref:Uncharacterized protein n=1 Tax=Actinobacillus delphinicola TaxID=51161 RepID=A0A448TV81_9PAST|nr:hypothetical protein [Actinobacillus delphinicola]VEJ09833.1 Uncharacterised protein [Actinobacillus delphinicola]